MKDLLTEWYGSSSEEGTGFWAERGTIPPPSQSMPLEEHVTEPSHLSPESNLNAREDLEMEENSCNFPGFSSFVVPPTAEGYRSPTFLCGAHNLETPQEQVQKQEEMPYDILGQRKRCREEVEAEHPPDSPWNPDICFSDCDGYETLWKRSKK